MGAYKYLEEMWRKKQSEPCRKGVGSVQLSFHIDL